MPAPVGTRRRVGSEPPLLPLPVPARRARKILEYEDEGVLDRTHLRLFTRRSAVNMFERQGYRVVSLAGVNGGFLRRRERWLTRLLSLASVGRLDDLRFMQYALVATPR